MDNIICWVPMTWYRVIVKDRWTQDEKIYGETRDYKKASQWIDEIKNDPFNKDHRYVGYTEILDV